MSKKVEWPDRPIERRESQVGHVESEVRKALTDAISRTSAWTGIRVEAQHELVDAVMENMSSKTWVEEFRSFLCPGCKEGGDGD